MPIIVEAGADNFISFGDGNRSWANTDRIRVLDSNESRCNTKNSKGDQARSLVARDFNFPQFPKYSRVQGIEFHIWRRQSDNNTTRDDTVRLVVSDTVVGQNKAISTNWATSTTKITYGSSNDTWQLTEQQLSDIFTSEYQISTAFGILFRPITETSSSFSANRSNLFINYLSITLYVVIEEAYIRINNQWVKRAIEVKVDTGYTTPIVFVRLNNEWVPASLS